MAPEAVLVNDPKVEHHFIDVGHGIRYHYQLAKPQEHPAVTVLLLHGWPDLAHGWRFQVPYLLTLGCQVVIPDMLGYGQTTAPDSPAQYSLKNMSNHLAQLIRAVGGSASSPLVVGAHDWGAFLAWRLVMYHPELVRAVFCFCVPFTPPQSSVLPLEDFVKENPAFAYQLQNAGSEAEALVGRSPAHLRGFLNAMFGGVTVDGMPGFDPYVGLIPERLLEVQRSPLVTPEVLEHYVSEYSRNSLHGPMNWYRTRSINGEDEIPLAKVTSRFQFQVPAMLIMAGQDPALTPDLADGQEIFFAKGLKKGVVPEASHWILIHCPEECNRYIGEFINELLKRD
ncbi:Alpha/Beta hydrolase protein [Hypoxylon rubiginosum]|uniref:Alpha/Beta hydrolase protein n=1 Tax=Hypoxylon rubiginosum TaxID=110542 RepID=A0ACB9ZE50_9PEZI|nr:Alpha/Beta hydrolase protein [Hypoxylon rubiginosum]